MRKFLLTLAVLCGTVSAWAQELVQITTDTSNPIYYTIYNTRSDSPGGFLYYAGDDAGLKDGCTATTIEDKYKFYFTGSDNELYVHNAATTKKLASVTEWTKTGVVWCVIKRNDGNLAFGPKDGDLNDNVWWNEQNQGRDGYTTWNANDAGSGFVVEPASEFAYPEIGKFYTIEAPLFEKVQGVAKGLVANGGNALGWNTVDLTNKNYYWTLVNQDGNLYLKNVGTGFYINGDAVRDTPAALTTYALGSNQFNIVTNNVKLHAAGHDSGNGASGGVTGWNGTVNSASAWTFVERADPDATIPVTIKYSFTYDGVEKFTQETNTLVGEEYPAINVVFPFGVSAINLPEGTILNEGIIDGVKEVEIQLSVELPFVPATEYASVTHWYYLKFHANYNNYLYYDGTENVLDASKTAVEASNKDAYTWAFVGNPFDGFKVVNKLAGEDKNVSATQEGAVVSGATTANVFKLTSSTHGTNGFYMQATNGDFQQRFNKQNDKVVYWSGADAGSTFMVEERNMDELGAAKEDLDAYLTTLYNNYYDGWGSGWRNQAGVNNYSQPEGDQPLNEAYEEAREFYNAINENTTVESINEKIEYLEALVANLTLNQPENNKFYRIRCVGGQKYLSSATSAVSDGGSDVRFEMVNQNLTDPNLMFMYNGSALLSYSQGLYINTHAFNTIGSQSNVEFTAAANDAKGQYNINVNGRFIYGQGNTKNNHVDSGTGTPTSTTTNGYNWWLEEVTSLPFTFKAAALGYATFNAPVTVQLPEGVKAYTSEIQEGNKLMMTELEDGIVPANTAVLLWNESVADADVTVNLTITENVTFEGTNSFVGTVASEILNAEMDCYSLQKGTNGKVGFYAKSTGTKGGFKAWIEMAKSSEARAFVIIFDGEDATGIKEALGLENENVEIYDLSGRRLDKPAKGVNVIGGKTVIVR